MKPAKVIVEKVRGFKFKDTVTEYSEMKAILYALGIGVSRDPMNLNDLNFTYERAENFKVLPTFGVVLGISGRLFDGLNSCPGLPEFNPMMLLHGEHKLELFRPFPGKQKLQIKNEITDIADKGKAALLTMQHTIFDENQALLCRNTVKLFIRGIGGFGDKGLSQDSLPAVPKNAPDKRCSDHVLPHQAILYRLSGDTNPLHVAPDMAALGGFDRPILHGLCFFGIAGRAILREFCGDDVTQFKSISARFISSVFPGETLITEMWAVAGGVIFQQKTQEREKVCLQGMVELNNPPKI